MLSSVALIPFILHLLAFSTNALYLENSSNETSQLNITGRSSIACKNKRACDVVGGYCQEVAAVPCNGCLRKGKIWCKNHKHCGCCIPRGCTYGSIAYKHASYLDTSSFDDCAQIQCNDGVWQIIGGICASSGGELVNGKCLIFNRAARTWSDAREACATRGWKLASFYDTNAVYDYITSNHPRIYFWTGGNDIAEEGNFTWLDGRTFVPSPWYPNRPWANPANGFPFDCIEVVGGGGYGDYACNARRSYICEIDETCVADEVPCQCDYNPVNNGCILGVPNLPNFACNCTFDTDNLTCSGTIVNCIDPTSFFCVTPGAGEGHCLQGGGNCMY